MTNEQTFRVTTSAGKFDVLATDAKAAKRTVAKTLGVKRLPAGARVESHDYLQR